MIFDFDSFTISAKLAYRRCKERVYSFEEALKVFHYYFDTYELVFDEAHPMISIEQIAGIMKKMPYVDDIEIPAEKYEMMIDKHFVTKYKNCDYNINHFFSGQIRYMRFYEVCY